MTTKKPTTEETLPDYFTDDDVVSWESPSPEELKDFEKRLVEGYIIAFNKAHKTELETLEEVEAYQKEHELTVESSVDFDELAKEMTARPREYVHTTGKLTKYVFGNKLTRKSGDSSTIFKVPLDNAKTIFVFVSLDYKNILESLGEGAQLPKLSDDDWEVFDGIVTNLVAGNWVMTYSMIYRGFTGKVENDTLRISDDIFDRIDNSLNNFRGILNINKSEAKDEASVEKSFDGPILHFDRIKEAVINGKKVNGEGKNGIIIVYALPSLYEFAQLNGNEVDVQDIKLLDVPKVNNTRDNMKIKRYLYKRVAAMRSNFKRNVIGNHKRMTLSRNILLSSLFNEIGRSIDTSTTKGRVEKTRVVKTIEKTLNHWRDLSFIVDYTWLKTEGSRELRGIEISFSKQIDRSSGRRK